MIEGLLDKLVLNWHPALQIVAYIIALAIGVFFLVKFCDIFVDSASSLAAKLHISALVIGLTVVSMGTSCPELAVSVSDSIVALKNGTTANVAIGNVVGSNICNILLVLGISIVFCPIVVNKKVLNRDFPYLLGASLLAAIFAIFFTVSGYPYGITRWEGIILSVLLIVYIVVLLRDAKKNPSGEEEEVKSKDMALWKAIILVVVGAVGIALGGSFVVFGAKNIAIKSAVAAGFDLELTEALVGLTIVAVGTSLPELVTSAIAAKKGENDIALGNVVGSNIFNILFVMGISATVNPLATGNVQFYVEIIVMLAVTVLAFLLSLKGKLGKKEGWLFLILYVGFVSYLVTRTIVSGF